MPKVKIGTFLTDLCKKAGVDTNSPELVDILSANLEIEDTLVSRINTNLVSMDAAENNPDLRAKLSAKFRAEALDGVDSQLNAILESGVFSATDVAEIKEVKGTYKKLELLGQKVKTVAEAKGDKKVETAEFTKQINELQKQLSEAKQGFETEKKSLLDSHESELTTFSLKQLLQTKEYALPDDMPAERKAKIALDALNEDLASKELVVKRVNGVPTLLRKDGTEYYNESSIKVGLNDYAEGVLNTNKLLKVAGAQSASHEIKLPEKGKDSKPINLEAANEMAEQAKAFS